VIITSTTLTSGPTPLWTSSTRLVFNTARAAGVSENSSIVKVLSVIVVWTFDGLRLGDAEGDALGEVDGCLLGDIEGEVEG